MESQHFFISWWNHCASTFLRFWTLGRSLWRCHKQPKVNIYLSPAPQDTSLMQSEFILFFSDVSWMKAKDSFKHWFIQFLFRFCPRHGSSFSFKLSLNFLWSTVNQKNITSDFNDLHATIQDIRLACQKMPATAEDRFAVVMSVSSIKISKMASVDDLIVYSSPHIKFIFTSWKVIIMTLVEARWWCTFFNKDSARFLNYIYKTMIMHIGCVFIHFMKVMYLELGNTLF